ncbi:hypothetical protein [Leeuwenhoekiella sp. ZYFB001]|uniref:hypothetical protein n=1 Tax=Leeuwenhoekiella sp. ZYFB001 TaxID=2719912 RepID=UPI0014317BF0|nr:hypothetical protein [Leeuwenhoekiella sp. ZYFB001]
MHKTVKHRISLVLLALFISMKMLGLHVLAHDGDQEHFVHCKLCEHAVVGDHYNPALLSDDTAFQVLTPQAPATIQIVDRYAFTFCDNFIANPLFSRPPPAQA